MTSGKVTKTGLQLSRQKGLKRIPISAQHKSHYILGKSRVLAVEYLLKKGESEGKTVRAQRGEQMNKFNMRIQSKIMVLVLKLDTKRKGTKKKA